MSEQVYFTHFCWKWWRPQLSTNVNIRWLNAACPWKVKISVRIQDNYSLNKEFTISLTKWGGCNGWPLKHCVLLVRGLYYVTLAKGMAPTALQKKAFLYFFYWNLNQRQITHFTLIRVPEIRFKENLSTLVVCSFFFCICIFNLSFFKQVSVP